MLEPNRKQNDDGFLMLGNMHEFIFPRWSICCWEGGINWLVLMQQSPICIYTKPN